MGTVADNVYASHCLSTCHAREIEGWITSPAH